MMKKWLELLRYFHKFLFGFDIAFEKYYNISFQISQIAQLNKLENNRGVLKFGVCHELGSDAKKMGRGTITAH